MTFRSYDSWEEMMADMRANEEAANERLAPEQKALTWGARVYRIEHGIHIFGHVYTREEALAAEIALSPPEEVERGLPEESVERLAEGLERGYLYGRWYSVIEPDGEIGSAHRLNVWPMSETLFEAVRQAGWSIDKMNPEDAYALGKVFYDGLSGGAQWSA